MGPRLDDQTLGMLGPTEFFGELSLLPIEGGWSHRRTAMVVQNSMLHTLSSADVQSVSDRFPELRHRLVDHAEDYQRVQAAASAAADIENLSAIKAKRVTTGQTAVAEQSKDPLAIVKAQLSQQDAKLEQQSGAANVKIPNLQSLHHHPLSKTLMHVRKRLRGLLMCACCRVPQHNCKGSWTCSRV